MATSLTWTSDRHEILLNPRWPAEDLTILRETADRILSSHASEASFLLSTSGSTAGSWREVKLVVISKRAVRAAAETVVRQFAFGPSDRLARTLPEFHVGGLGIGARAFASGATLVDLELDRWDAALFGALVAREKLTVISLVPTQLHDLVLAGLAPSKDLRIAFLGGGLLDPHLEKRARDLGWPIVMTYGMTETSAMIAVRSEPDPAMGLVPFPGVEVDVNEEGRLRIRTPSLATGFGRRWNDGRLEWTPIADDQGRFVTEDRGRVAGGRVFVEGRDRDWVKILGENVNLSVLREVLSSEMRRMGFLAQRAHLTVRPDSRRGSALVLFLEGELPEARIREAYDARVLPFERIVESRIVSVIPRTELGKVREEVLLSSDVQR